MNQVSEVKAPGNLDPTFGSAGVIELSGGVKLCTTAEQKVAYSF